MNSANSRSATSLPASAAGPVQLALLDGLTTGRSGPAPAPASRFHKPASVKGKTISGIYGPTSIGSSVPDGPLASWENRLREPLATLGSTEWPLAWKAKATPAGRWISRLAPSMRRTSEAASTGWPTPNAHPDAPNMSKTRERGRTAERLTEQCLGKLARDLAGWSSPANRDYRYPNAKSYTARGGGKKGEQLPNQAAQIVHWQTPGTDSFRSRGGNRKDEMGLDQCARYLAGWLTPDTSKGGLRKLDGKKSGGLNTQAALTGWSTPTSLAPAKDGYNEAGNSAGLVAIRNQILGMTGSSSDPTPKASTGALDPAFVCCLMGFPDEWLSCVDWATRSCRKKPRK